MKLLDEYRLIEAKRQTDAERIAEEFFGRLPQSVYLIGNHSNGFEPMEWQVTGVYPGFVPGAYFNKSPTRANVAALRDAEPITADSVFVGVKRQNANWSTSAAYKITEMGVRFHLSPEPLQQKAAELRDHYTLKPGQFHCAQCGKATDDASKVTRRIIARQYPGFGKEFDHCSAQCASHNQMAHEG